MKRLLEKVLAHFLPARKRREELERTAAIDEVLAQGERRARATAAKVLDAVRVAVGIGAAARG